VTEFDTGNLTWGEGYREGGLEGDCVDPHCEEGMELRAGGMNARYARSVATGFIHAHHWQALAARHRRLSCYSLLSTSEHKTGTSEIDVSSAW
jgi:hypothetical protein